MKKLRRTQLVNFRLTPQEFQALRARADAADMSVSDFVRTQLLVGREQIGVENRLAALEAAVERMVARRRVA